MLISALRTVIIYVVLIAVFRITGKRQLGELQPIELVVTLLLSDLAVLPLQESGMPLLSGLVPIAVLVALELLLSAWMMKSNGFSRLISGNPVVVIHEGKLQQKALRQLRLTVEDLTEALRQQGVFDWQEIEYAIAETNGKISVFTVADKSEEKRKASVPLINDGSFITWGLEFCGITKQEVLTFLKKKKCPLRAVLLLTADKQRRYSLTKKEEHL
ncbi:MAG: DUF421 domain-containing protein [Clostridia bacterium]|nr:DUF421 domain-containing protein [Clostridia bacterium]